MQGMPQTVAVTGASGYVGSWIVKLLLDAGVTVHATVRDPARQDRVAHLQAAAAEAPGELKLFAADLMKPGSFDEALVGCDAVIHSASPFFLRGFKSAQKELVDPAVQGTRNVLGSVKGVPGIKRVVLTSSVAAIYSDCSECEGRGGVFTEEHWNDISSVDHNPYSFSKTEAERAAWKMAENAEGWDLVTINPSFIIGPSLTSRRDSTSIDTVRSFLSGKHRMGLPFMGMGMVDVRDVAQAHLEALARPDAEGRHIVSGTDSSLHQIGETLDTVTGGRYADKLPKMLLPKFMLYVVGPLNGFSWRYVKENIGIPVRFRNDKAREKLGIEFRSMSDSLRDQVEQMQSMGLID